MDYSTDKPINDREHDEFRRHLFADRLVNELSNLKKDECFIIGIYARWGYGKTSTLNLIRNSIDSQDKKLLVPIFIDSWSYSGNISNLVPDIVQKISENLSIDKKKRAARKATKKAKRIIGTKGSAPNISIGPISISLDDIKESLLLASQNKLLKNTISEALKAEEKRVVVFIDNIDRLRGEEVYELLRQISQLANYGGVSYILPLDEDYVGRSIECCLPNGVKGREFLEKIIHIPLILPTISRNELDRSFTLKLQDLFNEYGIQLDNKELERFKTIYWFYGINTYIKTPRDIARAINSIRFYLRGKVGEINTIDGVVIELTRLFDEPLHTFIKNNKTLLISGGSFFTNEFAFDEDHERKRKKLLEIIDDKYTRRQVLSQLFPYTNEILGHGPKVSAEELRLSQRISSEYYFDAFFSEINEDTGSSDIELNEIIKNSNNTEYLKKKLPKIINESNYSNVLYKISDRKSSIIDRDLFCKCLLDIADRYDYGRGEAFMLSINEQILFTINDIIKIDDDRLSLCKSILEYNYDKKRYNSIPFLIRQVILYSTDNDTPVLEPNDLVDYKKSALNIIEKMASRKVIPLKRAVQSAFIYHYWVELKDESTVRNYTSNYLKTADDIIDFIIQFIGTWSTLGKSGRYYGDLNAESFKNISKYLDCDNAYELLLSDKRYESLKRIRAEDLVSFQHHDDEKIIELAKIGNEDNSDFRMIIAKRFIYYYEKQNNE